MDGVRIGTAALGQPSSGGRLGGRSRRRRLLLAGAAVLAAAVASTIAVRVATGSAAQHPAGYPAQDRPGAVVLVPGYGGGQGALQRLAGRLRATGRAVSIVTLPGDGTGDLAAQARTLDASVAAALAAGAPSVDVVGYSAGGVVARLWVDRYSGEHRARRIITLGAPLHGAQIAGLGALLLPGACPLACQQLAPGSALLTQLDASPLPARLPWLSLWTVDDRTVPPPDSAGLAGAVNLPLQQVCPGIQVSHSDLPTYPLVVGIVLRELGPSAVSAPARADCAGLQAAGS